MSDFDLHLNAILNPPAPVAPEDWKDARYAYVFVKTNDKIRNAVKYYGEYYDGRKASTCVKEWVAANGYDRQEVLEKFAKLYWTGRGFVIPNA